MSCVLQDFEIAGSRTGALSSAECAGGCECESPLGTVNSWDSHSHYRRRPASPDLSLYSGVILYCDHSHLRSTTGFFRLLLLVSISFAYLFLLRFRNGGSTVYTVHKIEEDVVKSLEQVVGSTLCDQSWTFDSISYDLLVKQLFRKKAFDLLALNSGVPQGSILGSFLLNNNFFNNVLPSYCF